MRLLYTGLLLLTHSFLFGQTATIKGKIEHRVNVSISFSIPEDPIVGMTTLADIVTDSFGQFKTTFKLNIKRPVRIDYNIPLKDGSPKL